MIIHSYKFSVAYVYYWSIRTHNRKINDSNLDGSLRFFISPCSWELIKISLDNPISWFVYANKLNTQKKHILVGFKIKSGLEFEGFFSGLIWFLFHSLKNLNHHCAITTSSNISWTLQNPKLQTNWTISFKKMAMEGDLNQDLNRKNVDELHKLKM